VVINSRSDRRRRRQLAGDDRTGVWNRRQNREQRLHVLRSNRWSFIGAVTVGGAVIAGVAFVIPWQFARGLFVGVGVSALVVVIGYLVLALSGTVARGMGATAEMWTASELRRLRKHGWLIVNGLALEGRDIDHVLVGAGGVVVVESKWSADGWDLRTPDRALAKAVDQVVANARSLRLWTAVKAKGAPVRSLVVAARAVLGELAGGSQVRRASRGSRGPLAVGALGTCIAAPTPPTNAMTNPRPAMSPTVMLGRRGSRGR
jgi:hypothetical protein